MSSTDFHSDDNLDSLVSQSSLSQRIDGLEDILDRHEAIFGTGQSPAEAPHQHCIPSPRDPAAYDLLDEPLPSRKPQHKEAKTRWVTTTNFRAQVTASDVGGGHADRPTASSS